MDLWAIYISGVSSQWFVYKHIFITFHSFLKLTFSKKKKVYECRYRYKLWQQKASGTEEGQLDKMSTEFYKC